MVGVSSVLGAGVEVAVAVGLLGAQQRDIRCQVDEHARVELDIGVDRADLERAVLQQLRDAHALRAGVGEVELAAMPFSNRSRCSARTIEQISMCRSCTRCGSHPARAGQEIGLLLVVALQRHPVARTQQRLKRLSKPRAVEYLALPICRHAGEPVRLGLSALIPYRWRGNLGRHATVPRGSSRSFGALTHSKPALSHSY